MIVVVLTVYWVVQAEFITLNFLINLSGLLQFIYTISPPVAQWLRCMMASNALDSTESLYQLLLRRTICHKSVDRHDNWDTKC